MDQRKGHITGSGGRVLGWAGLLGGSILGVSFLLWLILLVPRLLVPPASEASLRDVTDAAKRQELQDSRLKLQNDVRTTLLQGLGGLAVVVGAFFTYRQVKTNRGQLDHNIASSREQHELDRQGQITERFTRAIDQLGSDKLEVRLGGIYALERIARDSEDDRQPVSEVLTSYVRSRAPWRSSPYLSRSEWEELPLGRSASADKKGTATTRKGASVESQDNVDRLRFRAPDVQAALDVLSRRVVSSRGEEPRLNLNATDLRRSHLESANFAKASLRGVNLAGAWMLHIDLRGAFVDRSILHANLESAKLNGASLRGAWLEHAVNLDKALLHGAEADAETVWPHGFDYKAVGVIMTSGTAKRIKPGLGSGTGPHPPVRRTQILQLPKFLHVRQGIRRIRSRML